MVRKHITLTMLRRANHIILYSNKNDEKRGSVIILAPQIVRI